MAGSDRTIPLLTEVVVAALYDYTAQMNASSAVTIESRGPWSFSNAKTGAPYTLIRADKVPGNEDSLQRLVSVCNEPEIYDFLFRILLKGAPYSAPNATYFLDKAAQGWREQTHFIFVSLDSNQEICGAMDIKSNNRKQAEIGYWASKDHVGITSPGVNVLCEIAAKAGFESLFAFVKTTNPRSVAVLERNGFLKKPTIDHAKEYPRFLFVRSLAKN